MNPRLAAVLRAVALVLVGLFFLFPIVWVLLMSFGSVAVGLVVILRMVKIDI